MGRYYFLISFGLRGAAILLFLGFWQMQRLDWKESVIAEINDRMLGDPVALPASPSRERDAYLPVQISGKFAVGDDLRVLVSQKGTGAAYRVISALETTQGRIMVDRGVMALRETIAPTVDDEVVIVGNLQWPDETDSFTPAPEVDTNIWFARDAEEMAKVLRTQPILLVARETTPSTPNINPFPVDTSRIPNNHLQYAITWFSLAAVWLAMSVIFVFRGDRDSLES